jgi:hypothetical protein
MIFARPAERTPGAPGAVQRGGTSFCCLMLDAATSADDYDLRSSVSKLSWLSSSRFALKERALLSSESHELGRKLGKFGRAEPNTPAADGRAGRYFVDFSAQAVGELGPGDRYRILELKPGSFDE